MKNIKSEAAKLGKETPVAALMGLAFTTRCGESCQGHYLVRTKLSIATLMGVVSEG